MSGPPPNRLPNPLPGPLLRRAAGLLGTAGILATGALALLQAPAGMPPGPVARGPVAQGPVVQGPVVQGPGTVQACTLGAGGFLRGRFFGALDLEVDWAGSTLACDGMEKADGGGIRLFFSGERPDGGRVSLLIGLPGPPGALAGGERPANVTVIDERDGRFFSSAGPGRCWASVGSVTPVDPRPGQPAGSRIDGLVYCVGALPSVGDRSSLTLGDLRFSGWVAADAD